MLTPTVQTREAWCDRRGLRTRSVPPRSRRLPPAGLQGRHQGPMPVRASLQTAESQSHFGTVRLPPSLSRRILVSRAVPNAAEGTEETGGVGSRGTSPSSRWRDGVSSGPRAARPRRHLNAPASDVQPRHSTGPQAARGSQPRTPAATPALSCLAFCMSVCQDRHFVPQELGPTLPSGPSQT